MDRQPGAELPFIRDFCKFHERMKTTSISSMERRACYAILNAAFFAHRCATVFDTRANGASEVRSDDIPFYCRQLPPTEVLAVNSDYPLSALEDVWYATRAKIRVVAAVLEKRIRSRSDALTPYDVVSIDGHEWPRSCGRYTARMCFNELHWRLLLLEHRSFKHLLDEAVVQWRGFDCINERLLSRGITQSHPKFETSREKLVYRLHWERVEGVREFDLSSGEPDVVFDYLASKYRKELALENAALGGRKLKRQERCRPELDPAVIAHREETYRLLTENERTSSQSGGSSLEAGSDSWSSGDWQWLTPPSRSS